MARLPTQESPVAHKDRVGTFVSFDTIVVSEVVVEFVLFETACGHDVVVRYVSLSEVGCRGFCEASGRLAPIIQKFL